MRSTGWEVVEKPLAAPLWPLSDTDLLTELADCQELVHRAQARVASLLTETTSRGLCDPTGASAPRPHQLLRGATSCQLGLAEARKIARRAWVRAQLPALAARHDDGQVSTAFLDAAGSGLDKLVPDARATLDEILAGDAHICDPADIRRLIAQLRVMTEPEEATAQAEHQDELSRFSFDPVGSDGAYHLSGTLHGLQAERLHALLATYSNDLRRCGDTRPADQRRASALFTLAGIAEHATSAPGFRSAPHGADVHVTVYASAQTWAGEPGAPAATTTAGQTIDPATLEAIRCHTRTHGGPDILVGTVHGPTPARGTTDNPQHPDQQPDQHPDLPAELNPTDAQLVRTALAGLIPAPLALRFTPLTLGRSARLANPAQWQALLARDQHCVLPDCTTGPERSHAHHLREYDADTGPTNLTNLALVCDRQHTWLHRTGQHLHPPWCTCGCPTTTWTLHHHPPDIT